MIYSCIADVYSNVKAGSHTGAERGIPGFCSDFHPSFINEGSMPRYLDSGVDTSEEETDTLSDDALGKMIDEAEAGGFSDSWSIYDFLDRMKEEMNDAH